MAKQTLKQRKKNVRSKYWKTRADAAWGELIHRRNECAVGVGCAGNLEAHHLISRSNVCQRHDPENGILLCSKHHKFDPKLSAHKAPMAFSEWVQNNLPEAWAYCSENKYKIGKADYKAAYERLLKVLEE